MASIPKNDDWEIIWKSQPPMDKINAKHVLVIEGEFELVRFNVDVDHTNPIFALQCLACAQLQHGLNFRDVFRVYFVLKHVRVLRTC